jgi:hypothetical protein
MHGSEPFDFTWKEDPYFEKCLLRPHKKITNLPRKHDRKGGSIDALSAKICGKGAKLLPGITKILIKSVNQLCFGEGPSMLSFQMESHRAFYTRGVGVRLPGRRAFSQGLGLFRTLRFVETFVSRTQCSARLLQGSEPEVPSFGFNCNTINEAAPQTIFFQIPEAPPPGPIAMNETRRTSPIWFSVEPFSHLGGTLFASGWEPPHLCGGGALQRSEKIPAPISPASAADAGSSPDKRK